MASVGAVADNAPSVGAAMNSDPSNNINVTQIGDVLKLDMPCDAVEFCPLAGFEKWFVVGTYKLDETTRKKEGQVLLYEFTPPQAVPLAPATNKSVPADKWSHLHCEIACPAVFDIKWSPSALDASGAPVLAEVNADGQLVVYRLQTVASGAEDAKLQHSAADPSLKLVQWHSASVSKSAALSVDWSHRRDGPSSTPPSTAPQVAVSLSDGGISTWSASEAGLELVNAWQGHEYEAWVVAFDIFQAPHILYSGADDSLFKGWDQRIHGRGRCIFTDSSHGAGVCHIQCNPHQEYMLATGSYDEICRIWDTRSLKKPVCQYALPDGGGVWRLRWHPHRQHRNKLLVSCMRQGFHVFHVDGDLSRDEDGAEQKSVSASVATIPASCSLELHSSYFGHTDLAYGSDWCHLQNDGWNQRVVSCSFYDKQLHAWEVQKL